DRGGARAAALPRRQEGGAATRAHGRRGSDRGGLSRPDRLRGKPPRRARDPGPSVGAPDHRRLPQRGDGSRRSRAPARAHRIRCHSHRRARPARAFAAGARGALGASLRLSRRRAAGGAPHPSRDEPALALAGDRVRPWPARSGGDRARSRRSLARRRQRRRAARRAGLARLPRRGRSPCRGRLERVVVGPCPGEPRGAAPCSRHDAVDRGGTPAAVPGAVAHRRARARDRCSRFRCRGELRARRGIGRNLAGPVTREALAAALGLAPSEIAAALAALEAEGFAMRGRFTPAADGEEWCERRLLARIHGYTVKRLRAEIEPVAARDFLRFLLTWQRVAPDARMQGPDAVDTVVAQLEGFEAPAGAWEGEILPARLAGYEPTWLDDRCLAGQAAWMRLRPRAARSGNGGESRASPVRTTPITLVARRHAAHWTSLSPQADDIQPSVRAQAVVDHIRQHGASFFDELVDGTGLLRTQVEEALAELVALGLVSSDSVGGLRALLVPSGERRPLAGGRRRRRTAKSGMEEAGRWALARRPRPATSPAPAQAASEHIEHVARTLLLRYGVVFWRLIEREAAWLPPWRDLLRVYRRLESRGDIRGGRFVAGF